MFLRDLIGRLLLIIGLVGCIFGLSHPAKAQGDICQQCVSIGGGNHGCLLGQSSGYYNCTPPECANMPCPVDGMCWS